MIDVESLIDGGQGRPTFLARMLRRFSALFSPRPFRLADPAALDRQRAMAHALRLRARQLGADPAQIERLAFLESQLLRELRLRRAMQPTVQPPRQ